MKIKSFLILVLIFNLFFVTGTFAANTAKKKSGVKKHVVTKKKRKPSANANLLNSVYKCSPYTRVTDARIVQIIGWANRKCNYREIDSNYIHNCTFGVVQHQNLKKLIQNSKNKNSLNSIMLVDGFNDAFSGVCTKTDINGNPIDQVQDAVNGQK